MPIHYSSTKMRGAGISYFIGVFKTLSADGRRLKLIGVSGAVRQLRRIEPMNVNHVNPFLTAIESVLTQFGVSDITKGEIKVKNEMTLNSDVTAFIGFVGNIRGIIAYSFSFHTAKQLASAMLMGMEVSDFDEMTRSVLAEFANSFTGNAAMILEEEQVLIDITPPSVVLGGEMFFALRSGKTLMVTMETPLGNIEVDICLET
jgi:chemotaxis protein CheX